MPSTSTPGKAARLLELHRAPAILTLVNVWDVASARVVAGMPGIQALATASHSIAASLGYEDGEHIPVAATMRPTSRRGTATRRRRSARRSASARSAPTSRTR